MAWHVLPCIVAQGNRRAQDLLDEHGAPERIAPAELGDERGTWPRSDRGRGARRPYRRPYPGTLDLDRLRRQWPGAHFFTALRRHALLRQAWSPSLNSNPVLVALHRHRLSL
jgi:hypothetical protein